MRTKEEAIKTPEVGDAWMNKRGARRVITKNEDGRIIYYRGTRNGSTYLEWFQEWANKATFLGGAQ
jgi:hypothetical protein